MTGTGSTGLANDPGLRRYFYAPPPCAPDGGNSGEDWGGLFNAGAFGLLACFLLHRTGNLWMPIGLHMAFDWGETYFYGVANSGQTLPGHLLNPSSSGAAWLSGGTAGPEGSVLCTLLIVVVWLICAAWLREIKYPVISPLGQ